MKEDVSCPGNALFIKKYDGAHGYGIFDLCIAGDNTKFATVVGHCYSFRSAVLLCAVLCSPFFCSTLLSFPLLCFAVPFFLNLENIDSFSLLHLIMQ